MTCVECNGEGVILQDDDSDSVGLHLECEACNSDHKLIHVCPSCNWPCNCEETPCGCSCHEDELKT